MRKKIALWIALSCVICLGIAMWIYLTPTPFEGTGVTWNAQGEEISITVKLEERRFLWKPTVLRGSIQWNGIEYVDMHQYGLDPYDDAGLILSNLKAKFHGPGLNLFYCTNSDVLLNSILVIRDYSIKDGTIEIQNGTITHTIHMVE